VPRLGAPFGASWDDWPVSFDTLYFLFGLFGRAVGLARAANLAAVLSFPLSALGFFTSCRILGYARTWSAAGALLFAFSPFANFRQFGHIELSYVWHLPLVVLVCWGVRLGPRRLLLAGLVGLATGLQSPYFSFFSMQLLGLSAVGNWLRHRRAAALGAFVAIAGIALGFVMMNVETFSYQLRNGRNTAILARTLAEIEIFALKPIELVLPPVNSQLKVLRGVSERYRDESFVKGEAFSPYLGLLGTAAFGWLLAWSVTRSLRGRMLPPSFWLVAWILLFSCVGGINELLALLGLPLFRATNRFSIFLLVFGLLFAVKRLSILMRRVPVPAQVLLATIAVLFGVTDQYLSTNPGLSDRIRQIDITIANDEDFVGRLERRLPAGAMVFQLPATTFPEAGPVNAMPDYELFRPYLASHGLRFSYGDVKGRGRVAWQLELNDRAPAEVATELERLGFGAVIVDPRGFPEGTAVIRAFDSLGKEKISSRDERVAYILSPLAAPALPTIRPGSD
jgi:phosphoglycerol transferase